MEVGGRRGQLYYNSLWDSVLAGRCVPHRTTLKSLLIVNSAAEVSVSPKCMTVFTRARNIMIKKKKRKRNLYTQLTFMLNVA